MPLFVLAVLYAGFFFILGASEGKNHADALLGSNR
jgi:hypothetical protein